MTAEICCPVTFTAVVTDIPPGTDVAYEWSASDTSSVTISSPHARSTLISCDVPTALGWSGASLSVRASFAGEHLVSRLVFHYGSADPQVSVVFDKDGVIFEDRYEDSPGTWVERRSTNVALRVFAYGGSEGGTLQLTKSGFHRLHKLSGANLPTTSVAVGAGESVTYDAVYEGVEASSSEYDVSVSAVFTPNGSGDVASAQDSLTVIRLEFQAVYEAPENPCTNRHVYGVGEKVRFLHYPESASVTFSAVKGDVGDIGVGSSFYDTFGGDIAEADMNRIYVCPIASNYVPRTTMAYGNATYSPNIHIVEPQEVITRGVDWVDDHAAGVVGNGYLITTNYVGPMTVSFQGVILAEIPCYDAVPPVGYFATTYFSGYFTHRWAAGAGRISCVQTGNYWFTDVAGGGSYPNWESGRLVWKIPIGWGRIRPGLNVETDILMQAEHECDGDNNSRSLLIGGCNDMYEEVFVIDDDGASTVSKFGHRLLRLPTGEIFLDGEEQECK